MSVRRFAVRQSAIHGRGAFALVDLAAGERLADYEGEVITWEQAQRRYDDLEAEAGHTFFFDLGDGTVIDGGRGGNSVRWLNHGCDPNCEAVDHGGRIEIRTRRRVAAGAELLIDYALEVDDDARPDDEGSGIYACRCGSRRCRGTMLALSSTDAAAS